MIMLSVPIDHVTLELSIFVLVYVSVHSLPMRMARGGWMNAQHPVTATSEASTALVTSLVLKCVCLLDIWTRPDTAV